MNKVEDSLSLSDVTVNGLTYRQATLEEAQQICRMNGTTYQAGTLAQYKYIDKESCMKLKKKTPFISSRAGIVAKVAAKEIDCIDCGDPDKEAMATRLDGLV